jgi:hypothetical protein
MYKSFVVAATLAAVGLSVMPDPSQALTASECSAKYKAAKAAGNKLKWNDFRKAECAEGATSVTPAAAPASPPAATAPVKPAAAPKAAQPPKQATAPAQSGNAVFPAAIAPKYSSESAGKARMHTCLDQYNVNKAANGNGGMKWIDKGGGYYSECNKRLKG